MLANQELKLLRANPKSRAGIAMRILVLTPYYAPDLGASASLYEMLCEELVRLGHHVSILSAVPHYPTGRVPAEFRGRLIQRETRNGVEVTRIRIPSLDRAKPGFRLLGFLWFQCFASVVSWRRKTDLLIASNPAFEIALPLAILAFLRRTPFIYSVHEIYPDIGVKLGLFRNRAIIWLLQTMERLCCRRAAYVRVISEVYKTALEGPDIPGSKLVVVGDWTDTDFIRPLPRRNDFSARCGLDDHFVVLYAGNIGPTQGLEKLLEAARLLEHEPRFRFLIVGEGADKDELQCCAQRLKLQNIVFLPFQRREILPEVLATGDVSLVSLKKGLATDSVPSKLFTILASGRPVVAVVDPGSDIAKAIQEAQCGTTVEPENTRALADALLELLSKEHLRKLWGENGRAYVLNFRSKTAAAEKFQDLAAAIVHLPSKPAKERLAEI
jgi:colanic acid biosynthesis glycosyl transferase WcaI